MISFVYVLPILWQNRVFRMNPNIKILLDTSKYSKDTMSDGYHQLKELESTAVEYQRESKVRGAST